MKRIPRRSFLKHAGQATAAGYLTGGLPAASARIAIVADPADKMASAGPVQLGDRRTAPRGEGERCCLRGRLLPPPRSRRVSDRRDRWQAGDGSARRGLPARACQTERRARGPRIRLRHSRSRVRDHGTGRPRASRDRSCRGACARRRPSRNNPPTQSAVSTAPS